MSDAKIQMGERTWNVHKAILCLPGHNEYFEAALTGQFEVSTKPRPTLQLFCDPTTSTYRKKEEPTS